MAWRLLRKTSWGLLLLAVLTALLILAVRILSPAVSTNRDQIAAYLGDAFGMDLTMNELSFAWSGANPVLHAGGVEAKSRKVDGVATPDFSVHLDNLDIQLDLWRSLTSFSPVFKQFHVNGVDATLTQQEAGWLPIVSADSQDLPQPAVMPARDWQWLMGVIFSQPRVELDGTVTLIPLKGPKLVLNPLGALLENAGTEHQFSGQVRIPVLGPDTQINFAIQHHGNAEKKPFSGTYPFYLHVSSLGPQLLRLLNLPQSVPQLDADTELWGEFSQGQLNKVQGNLRLHRLQVGQNEHAVMLNDSHVDYALLKRDQGFQLQLSKIHLEHDDDSVDLPLIALNGDVESSKPHLDKLLIPEIDLARVGRLIEGVKKIPEMPRRILTKLSLQGKLENTQVSWSDPHDWRSFKLNTRLLNGSMKALHGAPALAGVGGLIEATMKGGRIQVDAGPEFDLHFPMLYEKGWRFDKARGVVGWAFRDKGFVINSGLLHLKREGINAAGRFSYYEPWDSKRQTELSLMIGVKDSDARQAQSLTPSSRVSSSLYRWLGESIVKGHIRSGGLVLHTGTRSVDDGFPMALHLFLDIDKSTLQYQPDWPALTQAKGHVAVDDDQLTVDLTHAQILDTQITDGVATLDGSDKILHIQAKTDGAAEDVDKLLRSKPLKVVGDTLSDWRMSGKVTSDLKLDIPVIDGGEPNIDLVSELKNASFGSESQRIAVSHINGDLSYSTQDGLSSKKLTGTLFGKDMTGSLGSEAGVTHVSAVGTADTSRLSKWLGMDGQKVVSGTLPYRSVLTLCLDRKLAPACKNLLSIHSTLAGTAINLPAPWQLSAKGKAPLAIDIPLDGKPVVRFGYNKTLNGVFDASSKGLRGAIMLGGKAPALPGAGLHLSGTIDRLSVDQIKTLSKTLSASSVGKKGSAAGQSDLEKNLFIDLDIGQFEVSKGKVVPNLSVRSQWFRNHQQLVLDSSAVAGTIDFPASPASPYQVHFSRLFIPANDKEGAAKNGSKEPKSQLSQNIDIPDIDLHVDDLRYGKRQLGQWHTRFKHPDGSKLAIQDITGQIGDIRITGGVNWSGNDSVADIKFDGSNVADVLEKLNVGRVFDASTFSSELQLKWPGAPWDIAYKGLDGQVDFLLKDGRIIDAGSGANLLRVFGILNFNTLSRRLRLNFSDLFQKGVAFDRLEGHYLLQKGVANTRSPLILHGPSVDLQATGSLDLVNETVNKDLQVSIPLTSNVPVAAVLMGAPQVAGAVFLIDKLFGDKIQRATSLRYHASGDWGDPQIKLEPENADKQDSEDKPQPRDIPVVDHSDGPAA